MNEEAKTIFILHLVGYEEEKVLKFRLLQENYKLVVKTINYAKRETVYKFVKLKTQN